MKIAVEAPPTTNKHLIRWVEKMADLTTPAAIHWVDGKQQEYDYLCGQLVANGTFTRLNQETWPGCFYARSDPKDVARVEERTYICSLSKEAAGPTNNWEDPFVMRKKLKSLFRGCMKGRTMYVLPFSMGPDWLAYGTHWRPTHRLALCCCEHAHYVSHRLARICRN